MYVFLLTTAFPNFPVLRYCSTICSRRLASCTLGRSFGCLERLEDARRQLDPIANSLVWWLITHITHLLTHNTPPSLESLCKVIVYFQTRRPSYVSCAWPALKGGSQKSAPSATVVAPVESPTCHVSRVPARKMLCEVSA